MTLEIAVKPKTVFRALVLAALALTMASAMGQFSKHCLSHGTLLGFVSKFNLDEESNFPTWFSSFLLLACSCLLFLIAQDRKVKRRRFSRRWTLLALLFLAMSVEEVAGLHELLTAHVHRNPRLRMTGFFTFAWVIPVLILVPILFLSYLRFLFHLPRRVRSLFVLAGGMYVGGALGMELIGGRIWGDYGINSPIYAVVNTVEEVLEMMGAIVFVRALMHCLEIHGCQAVQADGPELQQVAVLRPQSRLVGGRLEGGHGLPVGVGEPPRRSQEAVGVGGSPAAEDRPGGAPGKMRQPDRREAAPPAAGDG